MKTKIYSILLILQLGTVASAQILLSKTGGSPHPNALLDIKDSSKGVIFSKAADIINFPLYNSSTEDHFDDLPALEGSILYNQTDKQYYKYDGTTWVPAIQLGGFFNPYETRRQAGGSISWTCSSLTGCEPKKTIPLSGTDNRSQLLVNNLNLTTGADYVTIPVAGLYYISATIGFVGNSVLGSGSVTYNVNMDVSYDNGASWATLAFKSTNQNAGLFIDVGQNGNKSATVSTTATLPANARIRLAGTMLTIAAVSGYSNSANHADTFINIQRLK